MDVEVFLSWDKSGWGFVKVGRNKGMDLQLTSQGGRELNKVYLDN